MKNVRHSSEQPRWGTSERVLSVIHAVLTLADLGPSGDSSSLISIDPFSEDRFNKFVRAERILTGEHGLDGFKDRWLMRPDCPRADHIIAGYPVPMIGRTTTTAMVNPPGDDEGENVKKAWLLLDTYHRLGWINSAVWVAFNLNQMQTTQRASKRNLLDPAFVRCVPARREAFIPHVETDEREQPSHPMFFALLPSHDQDIAAEQVALFKSMCADFGAVI